MCVPLSKNIATLPGVSPHCTLSERQTERLLGEVLNMQVAMQAHLGAYLQHDAREHEGRILRAAACWKRPGADDREGLDNIDRMRYCSDGFPEKVRDAPGELR